MKTVYISYGAIHPVVLADKVQKAFNCSCIWREADDEFYEFSVYFCNQLAELEDYLADYM